MTFCIRACHVHSNGNDFSCLVHLIELCDYFVKIYICDDDDVDGAGRSCRLQLSVIRAQWLRGVEGVTWKSLLRSTGWRWTWWNWRKLIKRMDLLQWVGGWSGSVCIVGVFQLLQVHLPVGFLNRLVHLRLAHNLPHEILDGRLRIQLQKLRNAAVLVVEYLRLRSDFIWTLSAATGECIAERSFGFRVDLIGGELLFECARILWK